MRKFCHDRHINSVGVVADMHQKGTSGGAQGGQFSAQDPREDAELVQIAEPFTKSNGARIQAAEKRFGPDDFDLAIGCTQPFSHSHCKALHADLAVMGIIADKQDFFDGTQ